MNQADQTTTPLRADYTLAPAHEDDVAEIYGLLSAEASDGNLLPRSVVDISRNINFFFVVRSNDTVAGCAALEIFTDELGEVRSLVVDSNHGGQGLGAQLVGAVEKMARERSLSRLMALTYVPDFFQKLGYALVPRESLPEKIWGVCIRCYKFNDCDEIAVLKHLG